MRLFYSGWLIQFLNFVLSKILVGLAMCHFNTLENPQF